MENINTFQEGMNKDLSKSVFKAGTYINAENFSLITDVGLSTGTLRNIKGNEWFIDVPPCSNVIQVFDVVAGTALLSVTNGAFSFVSGPHNVTNTSDFGAALQNDPQFAANNLIVAYTDTNIVIYSGLVNNLLVNPVISASAVNASVNNNYVSFVSQPKIIGWGIIRDQIILFTTDNSDENPLNTAGQIWKLVYDKHTDVPVITLLYNGLLNFSSYRPIANPGGVVGNFETPQIQKIYWTDNYNRPKVFNIATPEGMALKPEDLDLVPNISKSVATVNRIVGGGNIKTGIYQVSARLINTSGAKSSFVIPSNPVPVVNEPEGTSITFASYEARDTAVTVSKSVIGKLYNLDQEYDRIEPVILYRETPQSSASVYILPSEPISNTGEYQFTYSGGSQTVIPISLEEFLENLIVFDTVKTMTSKNNMLFFGNVKYSDFDVDFDARAYRFTNSKTATLTNAAQNTQYVINNSNPANPFYVSQINNTWVGIPKTADAIQTNAAQAPNGKNYHLWQGDGVTFGGEGPNVKYEFTPIQSFRDTTNKQYKVPLDVNGISRIAPYASVDAVTTTIDLDGSSTTSYDQVNQYESYFNSSSPYVSYGLRGYQRDETYRFGIVFFSKKGQPSYVHWIGDIRMPKPYMPSTLAGAATENRDYLSFPLCTMYDGTTNAAGNSSTTPALGPLREFYGNPLGIKFTVDVSSIADQISGYSIVRVARTDADKTVLGQGVFSPVWYEGNGNDFDSYTVPGGQFSSWAAQPTDPAASNAGFKNCNFGISSPEFLFKEHPQFATGDEIDFLQVNEALHNIGSIVPWDGGNNTSFQGARVQKHYTAYSGGLAPKAANVTNNCYTPVPFHESKVFKKGETFTLPLSAQPGAANEIKNYPWPYDSYSPTFSGHYVKDSNNNKIARGLGGTRLVMGIRQTTSPARTLDSLNPFGSSDDFADLAYNDYLTQLNSFGNENIYLVNYRRPSNVQYGGNSYSARSFNEYVSTGHIQLVTSTSTVNTSMVFGGDTYVTLFDYANVLRNADVFGKTVEAGSNDFPTSYADTNALIDLVAVECSFPVELRKQNSKPTGTIDDGYTSNVRCAPNKSVIYQNWPNFITGGAGPYTTAEWTENFDVSLDYFGDNDVVKFFPLPDPFVDQNTFDVRVHRSQIKVNGELSDSWSVFKTEDYIDVDTSQGELNNLIIYQNTLIGFQDKGVVQLSVKERAISPDISGSEIILGTGGILENYTYISKIIGSRHQLGFTTSHDAVFWFDMNTKNMYKMSGGSPTAITVAKGMSSYMNNNLDGIIQIFDNPYLDRGITATYDFRYNEAIMTFKDIIKNNNTPISGNIVSALGSATYTIDTLNTQWAAPNTLVVCYFNNDLTPHTGVILNIISNTSITVQFNTNPSVLIGTVINLYSSEKKSFTVAYNDFIDAYTSFYSFTPNVYINDQTSIFSPDNSLVKLYRHDIGRHGVFYVDYINNPSVSYTPSKSLLKLIVNPGPTETKVFDNYEMITEVIDLASGANIVDDTFDRIRLYNDYQNTDFQSLPIDNGKDTAKRKERTWNLSNLRNRVDYTATSSPDIFTSLYSADQLFGERMRDKYLIVDLEYDNLNDRRLILHTFKTNFRKSAR